MMKSTFWQDRATLVTGATGLLGGWLVKRLLAEGAELVCVVRDWVPKSELLRSGLTDRVSLVRGDICEPGLLERVLGEYEVNTVFHLAAQTIVGIANSNPISTFETNIRGTWTLLDACRRSPRVGQIVLASSDKAYGEQQELPYHETAPLQGRFPYDASKSCADLLAQSYATTFGTPVVITRCGNFYGGGDLNWNRLVPGTIRSILNGERPVIRTDGQYVRDYVYIEDAAHAYVLLAEKLAQNPALRGEAFNFSSETPCSVMQIVERIREIMGTTLTPLILNEASNEIRRQYLSAAKARETLGWRPLFSLDEGLKKTVAWYKDFLRNERESRQT
jgi:CDP-glucose 4,6-dehydratase